MFVLGGISNGFRFSLTLDFFKLIFTHQVLFS